MTIESCPLIADSRHPGAKPKSGQRNGVGESLDAGVSPDKTLEGGEADEKDAEGHEEDEGGTHQGSVDDDDVVVVRRKFFIGADE